MYWIQNHVSLNRLLYLGIGILSAFDDQISVQFLGHVQKFENDLFWNVIGMIRMHLNFATSRGKVIRSRICSA